MKIQTLLANIGGVIKIIMVVFGYCASVLSNRSFYNKLLNILYCYSNAGLGDSKVDLGSSIINTKLQNNYLPNQGNRPNDSSIIELNKGLTNSPVQRKSIAVQKLRSFVMLDNNMHFQATFCNYVKWFLCKKCQSNVKEREIYVTGVNNIQQKLDIICYFKSVQILDHIVDTVYNEAQGDVVRSYQKVNLARIQAEKLNLNKDSLIKEYFKQKLELGELEDLDFKTFNLLPLSQKKDILNSQLASKNI